MQEAVHGFGYQETELDKENTGSEGHWKLIKGKAQKQRDRTLSIEFYLQNVEKGIPSALATNRITKMIVL